MREEQAVQSMHPVLPVAGTIVHAEQYHLPRGMGYGIIYANRK